MRNILITLKKTGIFIAGVVVILVGVILLAVPGPGLLVIVAGLFILSLEFDWAKRYLHQARSKLKEVGDKVKGKKTKKTLTKDVNRPSDHKGKGKSRNKRLKSHK